jgi:hypothetical protein
MTYRFASLSAGLLARKGGAQPAMGSVAGHDPRPPHALARVQPAPPPADFAWPPPVLAKPEPPAPPPGPAACHFTQSCAAAPDAVADPSKRFHVSVRLRQSHFVRLKIASALLKKPGQDIVAEALSAYFARQDPGFFGDCACARE